MLSPVVHLLIIASVCRAAVYAAAAGHADAQAAQPAQPRDPVALSRPMCWLRRRRSTGRPSLVLGGLVLAVGIVMFFVGWAGGGDAKLFAAASLWAGVALFPVFVLATRCQRRPHRRRDAGAPASGSARRAALGRDARLERAGVPNADPASPDPSGRSTCPMALPSPSVASRSLSPLDGG